MLKPIVVKEPRVDVSGDVDLNHIVFTGSKRTSTQVYPANSYQLNSPPVNSSWSITPPNLETIIDRFIKVRYYVECKADQDFSLNLNDAPRQFPISSITDVINLSINDENFSESIQNKLHALLCYGNTPEDRSKSWSASCARPDQFQQYADYLTLGSSRNPLGNYGECSIEPNRSVEYTIVDTKTVRFTVTEPLWVSPLYQGIGHQVEGMVNVNRLALNIRYSSDSGRAWSSTGANAKTSVSTTFYRVPELLVNYLSPLDSQKIPEFQLLPYQKINEFNKAMSDMAINAQLEVFSDTIRLSSIPKYLYLFARRRDDDNSFLTSDAFPSIEKIAVTFGNQNNLLSGATVEDLYEISRRNGLNVDYQGFRKYRGSVICLEFGKDIGLEEDESPGLNGSYNIQVQATFRNRCASIFKGEMMMLVINTGTVKIGNNQASITIGGLEMKQIENARDNAPQLHHSQVEDLQGGSFWSGLKNIVNKIAGVASPILTAVAPEFAPIARGVEALTRGSGLSGGRMSGGRMSGGMVHRRK